jgi:phosphatidylglycerol:prolipoprotein diacylglycerol transferase
VDATELVEWVHARDLPVFVALQALALLAAGIVFGARLFALKVIGWPRAHRNVQLVRYAAGAAIGCVAGGALLGPLLRLPRWLAGRGDPFAPGFVMAWGALGGAVLAAWLVARAHGASRWRVLDAIAPALGVLVALGRFGCFFAGCCFGAPASGTWAVTYPRGTPAYVEHVQRGLVAPDAVASMPVRPIALAEVALGVVMILLGMKLARRADRGIAFLAVMVTYALGRLVLERWRDDLGRGAGVGVASLLSLGVLALCAWGASVRRG